MRLPALKLRLRRGRSRGSATGACQARLRPGALRLCGEGGPGSKLIPSAGSRTAALLGSAEGPHGVLGSCHDLPSTPTCRQRAPTGCRRSTCRRSSRHLHALASGPDLLCARCTPVNERRKRARRALACMRGVLRAEPVWVETFTGLRMRQLEGLLRVVRERGGNGPGGGRPWCLPLADRVLLVAHRVLLVAVYYRTNLTTAAARAAVRRLAGDGVPCHPAAASPPRP
jgi:hypothetical protein